MTPADTSIRWWRVAPTPVVWKPLREVVERFPKKTPVDIDVGWRNAQHQLCCRLWVSFNPKAREFRYLRIPAFRRYDDL